jgi:hypothetical protein
LRAGRAVFAGSATAGAVKTGKYVGKTAQGYRITLKVRSHTLKLMNFSAKLRCGDGSILVDQESGFQPTPIRGGRFGETSVGSTDQVKISGRVRNRSVTGTLRVTDKLDGGVRCDSHAVKFTARHA